DSTREVVRSIVDHRVRLIEQKNGGAAAARNRGLREIGSEIVAFLDQDDVWFADKLATQLPLLDTEVGVVGSLMTYLGPKGPTGAICGEIADNQQERIAGARLMPFPPSAMIARAGLLRDIGGFDVDLFRTVAPIDDLHLLARVARTHRILTVPRPLVYYRIHADALSFSRFYDIQRGTRYLQARADVGTTGRDLTWQEWSDTARDTRSVRRNERAKFLYRTAGLRIVSGKRVRGVITLAGAAALAPKYVIPRLRRQLSI
ncbi:MAG: glycosyltransferase, partial [Actinobacteria bacterium]|nr:glycosyltransferase [Actinomycetota bacterium]